MGKHNIQRRLVWGGWLRLAHWLIAVSVLALIATGWLIKMAPSVAESASEWHDLASIGLMLGLMVRVWLMFFGQGVARWKALIPVRSDFRNMGLMLRFYLTLGRSPLPKWYAHNPLWAPIYVVVLIILVVQALSGLLMEARPLIWGFYLPAMHDVWATVLLIFAGLHVIAVVLHDVRGTASDVSAMINGHRIFVVEDADTASTPGIQTVSLDELRKSHSSK